MISLVLEDMTFEQDIRELLMAFYPGEKYIYTDEDSILSLFLSKDSKSYNIKIKSEDNVLEFISPLRETKFDTKNDLKRNIYENLLNLGNADLPWGTLTGIRPTKIVMEMLENNMPLEDIKKHLKDIYLVGDKRIKLCIETAKNEFNILKKVDYKNGYSLYIGIPFCPTRCLYCSFTSYSITQWKKDTDTYIEALCKELIAVSKMYADKKLQTIYMGGGTPTSLEGYQLSKILNVVKNNFDLSNILELTVEAGRPDSITREKLEALKAAGVDRISINPQTMQQKTLDLIGRQHTIKDIYESYRLARDVGFENINMDFIIGLNGETLEDVIDSFTKVKSFDPESITIHSLALKRAARLNTENKREIMDNDLILSMINTATDTCADLGLEPYYLYRQKNMAGNLENIGFSKPGKECLYNILIMEEKQTIIACGAGTSSKIVFGDGRIERIENVKDPKLYIERLDEMIMRKESMHGID
ncbi:coproporphyrinogen dehydrogenase HemZ [Lachnoanaerobaculum umeaense]|uniref:Coproporphyrinogen dehydrogenase HemZ n=1 Tax=Lachnoanaerobaculum umeaense TaxID=617123 RepID=A0A385Q455_9FIRM|nr:coproporphyrinogen dehydrogenase HemZ [Lachnoanaerobaculum umeaense]AYA99553.1 coproporphyrinogen dehydrogenase HemZ [Lachnoanaerobaculum umeaense]PZW96512.1 oxygen-independent coproporphyrinogen-3 oxidase [Lachnoanaerobaculum umeaense]